MLLALRGGGGPISRKIALSNTWMTPNIATNKWLHALIGVILVIKLLIRSLLVKLSHFPFTLSLLIFLGNYVPKNNYENWVGPDST